MEAITPRAATPDAYLYRQHCDFILGLLQLVYLHRSIWSSLLMQHFRSTLAFKLVVPLPPTLYLLPLKPHLCLMILDVSLHLLFFFPPLTPSGFFNRMVKGSLRARSTKLLHYLSSHLVDLICIQECNLNSSSSFRIPGFFALQSDCSHSWSSILSPDTVHTSGGSSFSTGRAHPFLNFLSPIFLRFTPTVIM